MGYYQRRVGASLYENGRKKWRRDERSGGVRYSVRYYVGTYGYREGPVCNIQLAPVNAK